MESVDATPPPTARRILRFWLPLEATWLMMAAEGPFLAAVIARLPAAKENLAAFGVATALAWIVESPIIMMLSASNALVRDKIAYPEAAPLLLRPERRRDRGHGRHDPASRLRRHRPPRDRT